MWQRRLCAAILFALCLFYGQLFWKIFNQTYSEDYERTYITKEFTTFPTPAGFPAEIFLGKSLKFGNIYELDVNEPIDLVKPAPRYRLEFNAWTAKNEKKAYLLRPSGRVFFRLMDEAAATRPYLVRTGLECARDISVAIGINGIDVGRFDCKNGEIMEKAFPVPVGTIAYNSYSDVAFKVDVSKTEAFLGRYVGIHIPSIIARSVTIMPMDRGP